MLHVGEFIGVMPATEVAKDLWNSHRWKIQAEKEYIQGGLHEQFLVMTVWDTPSSFLGRSRRYPGIADHFQGPKLDGIATGI